MQPIILTKADAFTKVMAAYNTGTLQAQTHPSTRCTYLDPITGSKCAIGHCLPDPKAVPNLLFACLVVDGYIRCDDTDWFQNLQSRHDSWAAASAADHPAKEQRFLDHLNLARPKLNVVL